MLDLLIYLLFDLFTRIFLIFCLKRQLLVALFFLYVPNNFIFLIFHCFFDFFLLFLLCLFDLLLFDYFCFLLFLLIFICCRILWCTTYTCLFFYNNIVLIAILLMIYMHNLAKLQHITQLITRYMIFVRSIIRARIMLTRTILITPILITK